MANAPRPGALRALFTAVRIAARPGGPTLWDRVVAVPRLVRATLRGEYAGVTFGRLALIAGAVGYVVSPVDLVPELFLPILGLVDDAFVLSWIAAQLVTQTEDFLAWERAKEQVAGDSRRTGAPPWPAAGPTVPGEVVR